ncbi:HET-domain-containing protein [Daldinia bambusicola]|nr:HET-domain-containing protein [Daldinia bambusicola]
MAFYAEYPLPEEGFIRTATIQPGEWRDELEISLNVVEFLNTDPPAYEALSYVWGSEDDPDPVRIITNTGKTFILPITQNLATALRLLRRPDDPRIVWTDAICINQANNIEKGQQVMKMGDIFRKASRVVGFLGEEGDGSARAMGIMSYIGSQVDVNWEPVNMWPSKHCTDPTIAAKHCKLPVETRDMCAIYHIIHRSWFERLWIRQEILLANSSAILQCGKVETSWREFRSALLCLFVKPVIVFEHSYSFRRRLEFIAGLIFPRRNISLTALHAQFGGAICRDPRDKIFATRSLLAPSERECCLVLDYNKPWQEVYKDVTLRWLRRFRFLALLRECHFDPEASHPSWVPNWSKVAPARLLCQQPFLASSTLATPIEYPMDGILRVSGVSCAEVQEVYHIPDLSNATMEELFNTHRYALFGHRVDQTDDHGLSDDLLDAYAKTLVWGCIANEMTDIPFIRLPSLGEAQTVIAELYSGSRYDPELFQPGSPGYEFLQGSRVVGGKKFARCSNGYFGMAPPHTQVGDRICVLIGFNVIVALRPMPNEQFVLLGEAYVDRLRIGEGLLGPLPENVQIFLTTHTDKAIFGFRDKVSHDITFEDPRLKNLPIDLSGYRDELVQDGSAILFVYPEVFNSIGVDVRSFDII